jgi:DNA-binding beta-propeller fold protein YncE
MRKPVLIVFLVACAVVIAPAGTPWAEEVGKEKTSSGEGAVKRLLYVTAPDGAMRQTAEPGIYVYDIDQGHRLARHISIPDMGGTRGCAASASAGRLYISHKNTNLMCVEIVTGKKIWEVSYPKEEGGADRCCVTPDGSKIYVPEGWWTDASKVLKVVDGETGKLRKKISLGVGTGHNCIMSPTGRRMYLGPIATGTLFVIDTATDEIIDRISPFGGKLQPDGSVVGGRVSPYTINGTESLCFVNSHHVGFYVGDLRAKKVLHWIQVEEAHGFSHGVGMTPDEKEIWVTNPNDKRLWVFDATVMPPERKRSIEVNCTSHGWISFSLDGRYAWPDTGDVIDAASKKVVAQLKGLDGETLIRSSKFIEIHFRDGVPIRVGDQFGIGRVGVK